MKKPVLVQFLWWMYVGYNGEQWESFLGFYLDAAPKFKKAKKLMRSILMVNILILYGV